MVALDRFSQYGSSVATVMFFWAMYQNYFPSNFRESLESITSRYSYKLFNYFSPYLDIIFDEYSGHHFSRNELYITIKNYLSDKSSTQGKCMKADYIEDGDSLLLSLGDDQEIVDVYKGVKVNWSLNKEIISRPSYSNFSTASEKRYYTLTFHSRDRKFILDTYLPYILAEGEAIAVRKRRRKLFTNAGNDGSDWASEMWTRIEFKHPARFEMLAMEESKKQMIVDDLLWFQSAKEYYSQVGKPWKRGYLLYGPPGTGKSTLVAVMANLLDYDIYDLELTSVKDNMHLRRLLIETTSKSIILIEDIDCTVDLTGRRASRCADDDEEEEENDPIPRRTKDAESERKGREVTLSGLLNFIDGIWSACGEERIIVFTTNHVDKLDPALIRRGRMDVHIELSYCRLEAFKVLAKNYLRLEAHPLFEIIEKLLEETNMTPADVAENLMPRSLNVNADACLQNLVSALEKAKEAKKLKRVEENDAEEA